MTRILSIFLLCSLMSACAAVQDTADNNHAAVCNELKHQIIFNGATSNDTKATQQRAQLDTLNDNYRTQGCS